MYRQVFFRDTQSNIRLRTMCVSVQWLYCIIILNLIPSKHLSASFILLDYALATNSNSQRRHIEVHNSLRPLHYPHIGCPQGEGDKGFETKNEML